MDNIIYKGARVGAISVDEAELSQINRHTARVFEAQELFTFKVALCDNQVDRDFERFTDEALDGLAKLFNGKTVIFDHTNKAASQCARIYAAEVEGDGTFKRLIAKCYMARCESNRDLITEIEAGIKKEVSVGCRMAQIKCSVCGADNRKTICEHIGGRTYGGKACHFTLEQPTDAYEVSFVAIPAQPCAGVVKQYGGKPAEHPETAIIAQRLRAGATDLFMKKQEDEA